MKNLKKLVLIMLTPAFVLFTSWVLSTYNNFTWNGIVFFSLAITGMQILLCIANSSKLIEPIPGYMIAGSLYTFIAADMCGDYEPIFDFFAMVIFAFTIFFVSLPPIIKWRKNKS